MLKKRTLTEFNFFQICHFRRKPIKRKGPTTFFLKSQVSKLQKEHKMSIPIKIISLSNKKKCQIRILQENFELNKLCMINL